MADNYTQFSEMITDVTPAEAEWIETVLIWGGSMDELATLLNVPKALLLEVEIPGFDFEIRTDVLWLHDDAGAFDLGFLTLFIQAFIQKWRPDYVFSMTWAATCSKPRVGEFGGGWAVVTKERIESGDTWSAMEEVRNSIKREEQ